MDVRTDMDLAEEIFEIAAPKTDIYRLDAAWSDRFGHPLYVDQGTFVPLYYLRQAGFTGQVVLMAPRFDDYDSMNLLGDLVVQAAAAWAGVSPSSRPVTCRTASCPVRPTAIRQKGPSSTRPSWKPCRNRTRPSSRP